MGKKERKRGKGKEGRRVRKEENKRKQGKGTKSGRERQAKRAEPANLYFKLRHCNELTSDSNE